MTVLLGRCTAYTVEGKLSSPAPGGMAVPRRAPPLRSGKCCERRKVTSPRSHSNWRGGRRPAGTMNAAKTGGPVKQPWSCRGGWCSLSSRKKTGPVHHWAHGFTRSPTRRINVARRFGSEPRNCLRARVRTAVSALRRGPLLVCTGMMMIAAPPWVVRRSRLAARNSKFKGKFWWAVAVVAGTSLRRRLYNKRIPAL